MASESTFAMDDASRPTIALPKGTQLRTEYRVGDVLGTGSFGVTYRAHDAHLDTAVAIKEYYPRQMVGRDPDGHTVRPHTDEDTEAFTFGLEQFMQEGRMVARFDHPNIVDVRSYFEENGTGYLVMDYYEGRTLAEHLAANGGRLAESEALSLIQDVLRGLQPVHEAGVLHRDIDPHNVYRPSDGRAVLIDFGAAREAMGKQSQSLSVVLTPGYAPIEQYASSGEQGPHTDIYACAATLYKCLTGLKPPEAADRVHEDTLVPPHDVRSDISLETSVAVQKGLALSPDRRPASAEAFLELLDAPSSDASSDPPSESPASAPAPATSDTVVATAAAPAQSPTEDAPVPEETDSSSTGESAASPVALLLGAAGVVGGTLALSDAGALEVLSFFGTWATLCVGLVVLFREGEKVMTREGRATVSDWLLREDFVHRQSNWPDTFTNLFDAVFTEHHLSWQCFWRSTLTSVLVIVLLLGGFMGFGLLGDFAPDSWRDASAFLLLAIPLALNPGIDYVSLFETRWILGKMSQTDRPTLHVAYLGVDLILTILCVFVPVGLVQIAAANPMGEQAVTTVAFWKNVVQVLGVLLEWLFSFQEADARLLSVMVFSTLFTSVWVWLYVGAGLLLRGLHPILRSLDWVKQYVDVETRPVHAMGILLAVLASVGFAASAPLVL